jgi:hypothetical protein
MQPAILQSLALAVAEAALLTTSAPRMRAAVTRNRGWRQPRLDCRAHVNAVEI